MTKNTMKNLPILTLQELSGYGVVEGLSIIKVSREPLAYQIFYSLEEQPGQTIPPIGWVRKTKKDEPKQYFSFQAAMSDIERITNTDSTVTTIWPHSHPAAEAYIEHLVEPEYSLAMY